MLTGAPPFTQRTLVELVQAKEIGTFPPARRFTSEVPERLDLIIMKMAHKKPEYRYATCAEAIKDLESLGLANARLSFLAPKPPTSGPVATPSALRPLPAGPSSSSRPKAPVEDAWYVRYMSTARQPVQKKMTTAQVLAMIEDPDFDSAATASRQANEVQRSLATYREFEPVMLARVSKTALDLQTSKYRRLYQKIDEEDRQRRHVEEKEKVPAARFWISILWRVAAVAGAIGLGYLLIAWIIHNLKGVFF
jgi:hypothetical protein